jgi:hypothetical protein
VPHKSIKKRIFLSLLLIPSTVILVFYLVAFVELNIVSIFLQINPSIVGVQDDNTKVVQYLKDGRTLPKLVLSEPNKLVRALAIEMSGENNFYSNFVLQVIPNGMVIPYKQNKDILLMDNTLFIATMNDSTLEKIGPLLGYLLIKQYFPDRVIKSYPHISLMNEKQYMQHRENEEHKKALQIDNELKKLESNKSLLVASIQQDKDKIQANKVALKHTHGNKALIIAITKNISDWTKRLQKEQVLLKEYDNYLSIFKDKKMGVVSQQSNISGELGVFEPKDTIKISIDNALQRHDGLAIGENQDRNFYKYMHTLTHEYLHYTSYVSEKKVLKEPFFEEGLTEYFARKAVEDSLHIHINVGYPAYVKIIEQMTQLIPESELATIYFTKDEEGLEKALDRVYGDSFYKNNEVLFASFQYASDSEQILHLTNSIMNKIGGKPLKESDLVSSL